VKTVTTNLSPSVGIDQIIKGLAKQTKGSLARTTFMADSQMYLSIPYKNIVAFETGSITFIKNSYARVLTDIGSDKDAFLFRVEKVTDGAKRGIGGEPGTRTNRNFYEFGNQFLKNYRG